MLVSGGKYFIKLQSKVRQEMLAANVNAEAVFDQLFKEGALMAKPRAPADFSETDFLRGFLQSASNRVHQDFPHEQQSPRSIWRDMKIARSPFSALRTISLTLDGTKPYRLEANAKASSVKRFERSWVRLFGTRRL
jgi:hypothetical protein